MSLPTHDLLPSIIATRAAHLGRLHGLAIDDRCGGFGVPPRTLSNFRPECVVDLLPGPVFTPSVEVAVDRLPQREVVGQVPPLTPSPKHIEDGVQNLAVSVLARLRTGL